MQNSSTVKRLDESIFPEISFATTVDSTTGGFSPRTAKSEPSLQVSATKSNLNLSIDFPNMTYVDSLPKIADTSEIINSNSRQAAVTHSHQADGSLHMVAASINDFEKYNNTYPFTQADNYCDNFVSESENQQKLLSTLLQEETLSSFFSYCTKNEKKTSNSEVLSLYMNEQLLLDETTTVASSNNSDTHSSVFRDTMMDNFTVIKEPNDNKNTRSSQQLASMPWKLATSRRKVQYRKTRLCPWYFSGRCMMKDACNYAHDKLELRDRPDLTRTRICPQMDSCVDPLCRFAHYNNELRATIAFYRTKICKFWQQGTCSAGVYCRHAHGLDQLRDPDESISGLSGIRSRKMPSTNSPQKEPVNAFGQKSSNIFETTTDPLTASRSASILSSDSPQQGNSYIDEENALINALVQFLVKPTSTH